MEIDLDKPVVSVIKLKAFTQKVQYENLPKLCFSCGKVGHDKSSCKSLLSVVTAA